MGEINAQGIARAVAFLEGGLMDGVRLEDAAAACGYSKYHFERLFTAMVGCTVYQYVRRRRLTEAARRLVDSQEPLVDVALSCGFENQQASTKAFRSLYGESPRVYRKKGAFYPLQLPFAPQAGREEKVLGRILSVQKVESPAWIVAGFRTHTGRGFQGIGRCWRRLHAAKRRFTGRTDPDFTVGLDDYRANFTREENQPGFDYCAGVEVSGDAGLPRRAVRVELPACTYLVFSFRAARRTRRSPSSRPSTAAGFPGRPRGLTRRRALTSCATGSRQTRGAKARLRSGFRCGAKNPG